MAVDITTVIVILVAIFVYLYITSRTYLIRGGADGFKEASTEKEATEHASPTYDTMATRADFGTSRPYTAERIDDLDTYEISAVFQNEGSREAGQAAISDAMSRYPLDWAQRPPSDERFQNYREAFIDASQKQTPPDTRSLESVQGLDMVPTDLTKLNAEELKILQTYKPEKAADLLSYSVEDVKTLIEKMYATKGLVAVVEPSKQGANVYEIVEVHKKNEPVVWEDDVPDVKRAEMRGEQQITVPPTVNDLAAGLDPYYEPRSQVRMNKNDYTKWTPGLERSFAPTYPVKSWY
jgi:hypothetical protein